MRPQTFFKAQVNKLINANNAELAMTNLVIFMVMSKLHKLNFYISYYIKSAQSCLPIMKNAASINGTVVT